MSSRLVLKSVTLNDLERRNGRYIALFISGAALYCIFTARPHGSPCRALY